MIRSLTLQYGSSPLWLRKLKRNFSRRLVLVGLLWASFIFAIDLTAPSGIATSVAYISLVLMSLWLPQIWYLFIAAGTGSLLTVIGYLNESNSDSFTVLSNHFISLFAIWTTAILCYLYKKDVEGAMMEIIHRLGRAAEYRDNETGQHINRLSRYSSRLGSEIGMDDEQCKLLAMASPLHDIGKIGIPDAIMLKNGKLSEEEWAVMKSHALIGSRILSGSKLKLLQMAEIIALTHHEKWNGEGYPLGLKGENIPVEGRIVAICDVFDALTSERVYKNAWSVEETIEYMRKEGGHHLDPHLIEVFIQILPDIIKIKNQFSEIPSTQDPINPVMDAPYVGRPPALGWRQDEPLGSI
jgi:hypothetical protein